MTEENEKEKMETASAAGSKGGIRKPKPMEMASGAGSKGGVRKPKPEDEKKNENG